MQNWNGVKFTREKKLGNSRLSKWKFQMKVLMYTWNILNFPFHLGKYKSGIWNSIFKDLCWISKSISYQIIRNQDLSQLTLFPPCIIKYIWFFQYQTFIRSRIFFCRARYLFTASDSRIKKNLESVCWQAHLEFLQVASSNVTFDIFVIQHTCRDIMTLGLVSCEFREMKAK